MTLTPNFNNRMRKGLTLIEIMVALTMTLIVLGSMMAAFRYASSEMATGRAMIELSNQLRNTEQMLVNDLEGATVEPKPYAQSTLPPGFMELTEGFLTDNSTLDADGSGIFDVAELNAAAANVDNYLGDVDDVLHLTVRSRGEPFRGRQFLPGTDEIFGTADDTIQILESSMAEVIYFTLHSDRDDDGAVDSDENISLYRRVLLIRPDLDLGLRDFADSRYIYDSTTTANVDLFFQLNDISARVDTATGAFVSNTLEDLADRQNRFCHGPVNSLTAATFPYHKQMYDYSIGAGVGYADRADATLPGSLAVRRMRARGTATDYTGEDIILSDVTAFDLRVFSPDARVDATSVSNIVIDPGDIGFVSTTAATAITGAYVDLGYENVALGSNLTLFGAFPNARSQLNVNLAGLPNVNGNVYDTWTPLYEKNGINEDSGSDTIFDEGTDGMDNDGANGVDDNMERETMPPYGYPVRGLQIILRVKEKNTAQMDQATVVKSFVPE